RSVSRTIGRSARINRLTSTTPMTDATTLNTTRLLLRRFELSDAPRLQELAADRRVAATTLRIPHPYEDGMAEAFIAGSRQRFAAGQSPTFAIVKRETEELVGAISLEIEATHARAELGYWIGTPYWGHGYATEAGRAIVQYAFDDLKLNRI